MRHLQLPRIVFSLLGCCLIFLLAGCGSGNPPTAGGTPTKGPGNLTPGVTPTLSGGNPPTGGTVPMPPTQTSCPSPGTARVLITARLQLGNHQNVVYVYNIGTSDSPNASFLKRHDITSGTDAVIKTFPDTYITNPQVSADGQWILFVAIAGGRARLQMIRMDGQGLQTLYCASPEGGANITSALSNVQWSTNQRLVVFGHFSSNGGNYNQVYLLNLASGSIQLELATTGGKTYTPITWLDNTRVYVSRQLPDGPPDSLYLLDTSRGTNQPESDLKLVFQDSNPNGYPCWSADSSYDGTAAFISQCNLASSSSHPGAGAQKGPGDILAQPATGGISHPLFGSTTEAITSVRAVSRSALLFIVDNEAFDPSINVDKSHNGLWKINTDGSALTRLTTAGNLNGVTQFPWSIVSRDGSMYSLQVISGNTQLLQFGSMRGGSPTTFASTTPGSTASLQIVGWTTM